MRFRGILGPEVIARGEPAVPGRSASMGLGLFRREAENRTRLLATTKVLSRPLGGSMT